MPFCAYCGKEVSDQTRACPECGHPRSVQPPEPSREMRMLLPVGRSGWAIAAGYVALFAIVAFPLAPVALVFGLLARRDIRRTPGVHGMGRAAFAIVVGSVVSLAATVLIVYSALN